MDFTYYIQIMLEDTDTSVIPKGFRMKDGDFEDICPYYREL